MKYGLCNFLIMGSIWLHHQVIVLLLYGRYCACTLYFTASNSRLDVKIEVPLFWFFSMDRFEIFQVNLDEQSMSGCWGMPLLTISGREMQCSLA